MPTIMVKALVYVQYELLGCINTLPNTYNILYVGLNLMELGF